MRPVQQPSIAKDVVQKGEDVVERIKLYEVSLLYYVKSFSLFRDYYNK